MKRSAQARAPGVVVALVLAAATSAIGQETQGTHDVRAGDTLWDLAGRYLAAPYQWPEIFELNPDVVEDPHWIFPGETLRIPGRLGQVGKGEPGFVAPDAEEAPPQVVEADRHVSRAARRPQAEPSGAYPAGSVFRQPRRSVPTEGELHLSAAVPLAVVSPSDFYRAAVMAGREAYPVQGRTARVVEENPLDLNLPPAARLNDEVVVSLGGLLVEEGDVLRAVRWGRIIENQARVLSSMALLNVSRVDGDSARAAVTAIFDDYQVGDPVILAETYALDPEARPEPIDGGLVTRIVDFVVPQTVLGPGEMAFLDAGTASGVTIGDEFVAFSNTERFPGSADVKDGLCTLRVLRVTQATATVMVIAVRDPGMRPGMAVRLVRRMPSGTGG